MLGDLMEREGECAVIERAVDDVGRAGGRVIVVEGEAGIGKTALLEHAALVADAAGFFVRRAMAVALERDFGYGVVRQLFERWIVGLGEAERDALLSGPASAASAVFGAPAPGGDRGEGDPAFVVRHALFWVASRLASETPLVIVVDDAQWADGASLRWLAHVARRIGDAPVLLVLAFRVGERSVDAEAVAQIRSVAGGSLLRPAPLSASAVLGLARRTLGSAGDGFAEACHTRTGGNPLFVHELLRAVLDEDVDAGEDPAVVLELIGSQHAVDRAVRRLEAVSETGRRVAFAVAVLGAAHVYEAAALASVAPEAAEAAGDELLGAGILGVGRPWRFVHPLVRDAVEEMLAPGRRSSAHRRAAVLLAADPDRADEAAAHLLHCGPASDPWAVDVLCAAAQRAAARGAHDAATVLLRRALDEPAGDVRPDVMLALGRSETRGGRQGDAIVHLRAALSEARGAKRREAAVRELVQALVIDERVEEAVAVLEAAMVDLESPDDVLGEARLWLEAELANVALQHGVAIDRAIARLLRSASIVTGETPAEVAVRALAAYWGYWSASAPAEEAAAVLEGSFDELVVAHAPIVGRVLGVVLFAGHADVARRLAERALARARDQGDVRLELGMLANLCRIELETGFLDEAIATAEETLGRGIESAVRYALPAVLGIVARALVERGRAEAADRLLGSTPPGEVVGVVGNYHVGRMRVNSALSRHEQAVQDAETVLARMHARRHAGLRLGDLAAEALLLAGRTERAVEVAEVGLVAARQWGADWTVASYERVLGLARQDAARLARAVELLEGQPFRLERAKALVALGAWLRRDGRRSEARPLLRSALDLSERMRADPLRETAETELRACGARPRRLLLTGVESLTASELRVARLAAGGLSNPRIAQSLFVSRPTVESHMRSIFRKLDITSRDQIGPALAVRKDHGGTTMRSTPGGEDADGVSDRRRRS